jgi:hypothetical protein
MDGAKLCSIFSCVVLLGTGGSADIAQAGQIFIRIM